MNKLWLFVRFYLARGYLAGIVVGGTATVFYPAPLIDKVLAIAAAFLVTMLAGAFISCEPGLPSADGPV